MERSWHHERLRRLSIALLATFAAVALILAYWTVVRGTALAERQDNPRRVEAELRIRRGRILDSQGAVLAETVGPREAPQRVYPLAGAGPAVGYYSFRHGTAGIEEGYDAVLRGDSENVWEAFWRHSLHEAQRGRDIRLALNADWQRVADTLLEGHKGAVVLVTLPEGAIAVMASHPNYDPNRLDEEFTTLAASADAPLLNRATQGQYQPGLVMQPFLLAAAVDNGVIGLGDEVPGANNPILVHGQRRQCATAPPEPATWRDVLEHACPYPMLPLGEQMGASGIQTALAGFGLTGRPDVPLAAAQPPPSTVTASAAAVIGQGELTVSPLQVVLALAALGNQGLVLAPQLVSAVQNEGGAWESAPPGDAPEAAVSSGVATAISAALPQRSGTISEFAVLALAGPGGSSNAWYLALAPAQNPRYALVAVLEEQADLQPVVSAGRALLDDILRESP
jgi:penicillin-binding protein A